MIVKNEESNLKRCLQSICELVDEMIIVDTGSTDSTVAIAEAFGAKVSYYEWNDDFSQARNFALKQAACDWIFMMDADDELDESGKQAVLELVQTGDADAYFFETISYVGETPGADVLKNMNVRLMRNFRGYFFSNPIHEQIYCNIKAVHPDAVFRSLPIVVYHYGYLNSNIARQGKRARNIRLLETELKETPDYPFSLFNLGSEYYAQGDNEKAIAYFEQSYNKFNPAEGFSSHLLLKMAHCYCALGRYEQATQICSTGLSHYPFFTDLEYMRGVVCMAGAKQLLAIGHFKKCVEMGEAPFPYNVIAGTGTYRAHYMLGQLYFDLLDYESAAAHFKSAFLACPDYAASIVLFVKSKCRLNAPGEELEAQLKELRAKTPLGNNEKIIDSLISGKYFNLALKLLDELAAQLPAKASLLYKKGLCYLYTKRYDEAEKAFKPLVKEPGARVRALCMQALCKVCKGDLPGAQRRLLLARSDRPAQWRVFHAFLTLLKTGSAPVLEDDAAKSMLYLPAIFDILRALLCTNQFETFEKALHLLNTITNKSVLTELAKLYYEEDCYGLAYKELIRSIVLYETIDTEGAKMLATLKSMGF